MRAHRFPSTRYVRHRREPYAWIPAFAGMTSKIQELVVPAEAGTQKDGGHSKRVSRADEALDSRQVHAGMTSRSVST